MTAARSAATPSTQGMNGLMLVRTNGLRIWNNNFSFNSGLGIGLYRSSGNSSCTTASTTTCAATAKDSTGAARTRPIC